MASNFQSECTVDSPPFVDESLCRSIIGSHQYLAFTRPDISYAVNKIYQYMHNPRQVHWQAVKRVLCYLSGTTDHTFLISAQSSCSPSAFSDADWAGDQHIGGLRVPTTFFLGSNLISWSSRKQNTAPSLKPLVVRFNRS